MKPTLTTLAMHPIFDGCMESLRVKYENKPLLDALRDKAANLQGRDDLSMLEQDFIALVNSLDKSP